MSDIVADKAANTFQPPRLPTSHDRKVTTVSTSGAAGRSALPQYTSATSGGNTTQKYYLTVTAITADCYVAFKLGTAAASVTTSTGYCIPAGQERSYWICPSQENDIEYITGGSAGTLQMFISSPPYEGS